MHGARTVVAAALLAAGGVAYAQGGARTHDGFFLQLDLGAGYLRSEFDERGADVKLDGGAGEFSVALGYNVAPNFIVGGQLWGASAGDADVEVNGATATGADATVALGGIGLNLTYYFMPVNLYLQATPSLLTLTGELNDVDFESDPGFGLRLAVGKEWWVSDSWAIGLNAQAAFSSNDHDTGLSLPSGSWTTQWYGLAFSATYD
jgi:hypothetical protein